MSLPTASEPYRITGSRRQDETKVRHHRPYLDLARGLAALLVATSHLRAFVFVDYNSTLSPAWLAFYFITGFGHQAVMIFFVLSGFLVGGSVIQSKEWSWISYAIGRLVRLWVVLLPALLLTEFWDRAGMILTHSPFYLGVLTGVYNSGPTSDASQFYFSTLMGNAVFLQTIFVPTFGSNAPLWSLANEFWYYVLFPLALFSIAPGKTTFPTRIMHAFVAAIICCFLPAGILLASFYWLLGVAAFLVRKKLDPSLHLRTAIFVCSAVALMTALVVSRLSAWRGSDFAISAAFAAFLVPLAGIRDIPSKFATMWEGLAGFSYTLYLVHFPFVAFLSCYFLENRKSAATMSGLYVYITMLGLVMVYAAGMYFLFERNTDLVRSWVSRCLERTPVLRNL